MVKVIILAASIVMYAMIMIIMYMKSALQSFLCSGVFTLDEIIICISINWQYNYMDEFAEDFNNW